MRLRQKLFAAVLAVMVILFLMLALVSFMRGLETQRLRVEWENGFAEFAVRDFRRAASEGTDSVKALEERLRGLALPHEWKVLAFDEAIPDSGTFDLFDHTEVAREGRYLLVRSRNPAGLEVLGWLPGVFWAVGGGTVFLLLVVYGLLLRLVLRPIENLVDASRALSAGSNPRKVPGENRSDEMGELIGAFNRMTAEVCERRDDLQRRVEEATRDFERAQKRLVLEQRLAATGKLAAGIAHEINNPLGGMINAARSLSEKEGTLSERGREYLGLIEEGLGRIAGIVERMRAFVKPRPSVGPVDLGEAVGSAVAFARHRVDKESVQLREEIPPEPVTVTGDAGELQQVFLNLILNAVDAMRDVETRGLTLRLETSGEEAVLSVTDTGRGMDAEQLASAFDLFYSTKGEGGTGLGLAITHKIVTDHGGAIEIESSPAEGTTARVRLPLADAGGEESGRS